MIKIQGVGFRRRGYKIHIANVPRRYHRPLVYFGKFREYAEILLAFIGGVVYVSNLTLSFPIITLLLSMAVFIELGRPEIHFAYPRTEIWTGPYHVDENGTFGEDYDPPISVGFPIYYIDNNGNKIEYDELGLYDTDRAVLEIPKGNLKAMERDHSMMVDIPISVETITLKMQEES